MLVIGLNHLWKQAVALGKVNNQDFVSIPHQRFVDMLVYKCQLSGISVLLTEESYTSVASFIDGDTIPTIAGLKPTGTFNWVCSSAVFASSGEDSATTSLKIDPVV